MDLSKHLPKLGLVTEISNSLAKMNSNEPASISTIELRMNNMKQPMEVEIPQKLNQLEDTLQAALSSNLKLQDEADGLLRWLNKMEIALKSESPLSADENVVKRQGKEHEYLVEDIARYFI